MGDFTASVFVTRSPQDVFDFLSDPANLSTWNSSFESAQWSSSGPSHVGSTYRVVARMLGAGKQGTFEIVEWDPPGRYGYRSNQRVFPIERMQTVLTLDPEDGGTRVTMNGQFALVGVLRFAERPFARLAAKQDGDNLLAAKRLLEDGG